MAKESGGQAGKRLGAIEGEGGGVKFELGERVYISAHYDGDPGDIFAYIRSKVQYNGMCGEVIARYENDGDYHWYIVILDKRQAHFGESHVAFGESHLRHLRAASCVLSWKECGF
jgi:hypothetical protein